MAEKVVITAKGYARKTKIWPKDQKLNLCHKNQKNNNTTQRQNFQPTKC